MTSQSGLMMRKRKRDLKIIWAESGDAVIGSGVPESTPEWCARWVRKFALSIKGKPLWERSAEDVRAFLSALESRENIEPWQVKQPGDSPKPSYDAASFSLTHKPISS